MYCTILYTTVLYCTVLYCIGLYSTIHYYIVLYCTICYCTVLYPTVLYCTIHYCTILYCIVLYCTVIYATELYCIILYCTIRYHCKLSESERASCPSDQATFKGMIINGPTRRLTEKVKVSKLLLQWMGLDKMVYYSATTTNGCEHLYQIWTKNYIISGTRRLTKEVNISKQLGGAFNFNWNT